MNIKNLYVVAFILLATNLIYTKLELLGLVTILSGILIVAVGFMTALVVFKYKDRLSILANIGGE